MIPIHTEVGFETDSDKHIDKPLLCLDSQLAEIEALPGNPSCDALSLEAVYEELDWRECCPSLTKDVNARPAFIPTRHSCRANQFCGSSSACYQQDCAISVSSWKRARVRKSCVGVRRELPGSVVLTERNLTPSPFDLLSPSLPNLALPFNTDHDFYHCLVTCTAISKKLVAIWRQLDSSAEQA